jgi:hypothetical protein
MVKLSSLNSYQLRFNEVITDERFPVWDKWISLQTRVWADSPSQVSMEKLEPELLNSKKENLKQQQVITKSEIFLKIHFSLSSKSDFH